jgi:hypothetical protein
MQRLQKHNQLKPLNDLSQSKIAPLNKENLGKLRTEGGEEEGSQNPIQEESNVLPQLNNGGNGMNAAEETNPMNDEDGN